MGDFLLVDNIVLSKQGMLKTNLKYKMIQKQIDYSCYKGIIMCKMYNLSFSPFSGYIGINPTKIGIMG